MIPLLFGLLVSLLTQPAPEGNRCLHAAGGEVPTRRSSRWP